MGVKKLGVFLCSALYLGVFGVGMFSPTAASADQEVGGKKVYSVDSDGDGFSDEVYVEGKTRVPLNSGTRAYRSLKGVCKRNQSSGWLYKESSDHSGPPREGKPAIIFPKNRPNKDSLNVYARNGTKICSFKRWYAEEAKYGRRFYAGTGCGKSARQIADAAKKASGSTNIYIEGAGTACVGPLDPRKRRDKR